MQPTPATAPSKVSAPRSVVAAVCAPVGLPLCSQLQKRAASNQLTYVIGRLLLSPPLLMTAYFEPALAPDVYEIPAMLRLVAIDEL